MTTSTTIASRRQARALALQILYASDGDGDTDVDAAIAAWPADFELEIDDDGRALAGRLAADAVAGGAAIDERIAAASRNWRLERMGRVDRNILRLAVAELVSAPDTPVRVVINEAVELAKRFGTADSSAFVNGLLDWIAAGLGRDRELPPVLSAGPAGAGVEGSKAEVAGPEPVLSTGDAHAAAGVEGPDPGPGDPT